MADTNVLVYAVNRAAPEHNRCRELVDGWRRGPSPWYLTWSIVYEFLRVVTHPRVLERPLKATEAASFLAALLASPSLSILRHTARHPEILRQTLDELPMVRGNLLHDVHTAVLMREHGLREIRTRDADFHRFPFLEVVDPLA